MAKATARVLFKYAMDEKLPREAPLEPLYSEIAVEKAVANIADLDSASRKQLRALIALLEVRYQKLAADLTMASNGIDMAHIQGRVKECVGYLAFFRHMLSMKEIDTNE